MYCTDLFESRCTRFRYKSELLVVGTIGFDRDPIRIVLGVGPKCLLVSPVY